MKKKPKNKHLLKPLCAHPAWIFLIGLYYPPFLPYPHIWKKVIRAEVIEKKNCLDPPPIFVFKFVLNPPLPQPPWQENENGLDPQPLSLTLPARK